jgi:hypothetical protein
MPAAGKGVAHKKVKMIQMQQIILGSHRIGWFATGQGDDMRRIMAMALQYNPNFRAQDEFVAGLVMIEIGQALQRVRERAMAHIVQQSGQAQGLVAGLKVGGQG